MPFPTMTAMKNWVSNVNKAERNFFNSVEKAKVVANKVKNIQRPTKEHIANLNNAVKKVMIARKKYDMAMKIRNGKK